MVIRTSAWQVQHPARNAKITTALDRALDNALPSFAVAVLGFAIVFQEISAICIRQPGG